MRYALDYDFERVHAFVSERTPINRVSGAQAIGLARDSELIAGAVYEGFNGHNVWVHLAGMPGRRWMTRQFLYAGFAYPFIQLGCSRISGYVEAWNLEARRLDEHFGYKQEAVLHGAASDGGDVILYVMRREDCRYV
jgi:RimJ/RimL family protein N-acetyltransferase